MTSIDRRCFLQQSSRGALGILGAFLAGTKPFPANAFAAPDRPPSILFAIADDWSWPHASVYGARGVETPTFDRIAREGCLFANAFTAAPQCSPNRAATLTGRNIWQLEEAGTHGSVFPDKFEVFPDLLEAAGYHVGFTGKGWGPGSWERGGWQRNPAGPEYNTLKRESVPARGINKKDYAGDFEVFLAKRPDNAPFCFWFGGHEPHRTYERGSGLKAGKDPSEVTLPQFLPDARTVREDLLDYFLEIEWFDSQLGAMLNRLAAIGELDNTIIVATGDNGMPFPRAKANLYEYGTHVPLAIRWPERVRGGRVLDGPVSFIDFAPTFLQAAGIAPPAAMSGKSFLGQLTPAEPHTIDPPRDFVLTGRERHTHARFDNLGYPSRAIRTRQYLYIRNFKPERWPTGNPDGYHDADESPTKTFMMENRGAAGKLFDLAFGKRPAEELYGIKADPACMNNLAHKAEYAAVRQELREKLERVLTEQKDPRALGSGDIFESYPRIGHMRPQLGGFAERGEYNPRYGPVPDAE